MPMIMNLPTLFIDTVDIREKYEEDIDEKIRWKCMQRQ